VGGRGHGGPDGHVVSRFVTLGLLAVVAAAFGVYVIEAQPAWYERLRYPLLYEEFVTGHADNYGLEPQLVAAVIYQESKFDAAARSSSGAVGLMQLLPETGQGIADRTGGGKWSPDDLLNPELNIRYGSWYLRHLLDKYGDEALALAAYNAGQANVDSWRKRGVGIQFDETRHYVARVQDLKRIYARAYASELGLR
jgi:peptidoglycan lytic transglycosylase